MRYLGAVLVTLACACVVRAQTPPTFQTSQLSAGCPPSETAQVLTGDFNGDGKPDLAFYCAYGTISVLLGNGDGTFQAPVVTTGVNSNYNLIIAADLNHDGKTDLLFDVGYSGGYGISVMLASEGGNFEPARTTGILSVLSGMTVGDLNGDGIPDFIELGPIYYAPGKGDGTFSSVVSLPALPANCGPRSTIAVVADFNGDGKADLAVGTLCSEVHTTYLYLGTGGGSFSSPTVVASLGGEQLNVGDFNNDGKLDLLIGDLGTRTVYMVAGNGDGTFQAPIKAGGSFIGSSVIADFNGDGNLDFAVPASAPELAILLGQGNGTFEPTPNPVPVNSTDYYFTPGLADFNGDGKPDLVTAGGTLLINTSVFTSVPAVVNGASFTKSQPVAPGSLVSIFGSFPGAEKALAGSIPLPSSLGNVSVTMNGTTAPLQFVSATQINAQVPWEVSGSPTVVVTVGGTAEPSFTLQMQPVAPGIFTTQSGLGQAIAINADGSLAGPSGSIPGLAVHPANPGDALIILGTGLGAVTPAIADGAASSDALRKANLVPQVTIGGMPAQVIFAGLSPQFVGVNQLNVIVPNVPAGVVPLQINAGGVETSGQVTIAVGAP